MLITSLITHRCQKRDEANSGLIQILRQQNLELIQIKESLTGKINEANEALIKCQNDHVNFVKSMDTTKKIIEKVLGHEQIEKVA